MSPCNTVLAGVSPAAYRSTGLLDDSGISGSCGFRMITVAILHDHTPDTGHTLPLMPACDNGKLQHTSM